MQDEKTAAGYGQDDMTKATGWDALAEDAFGLSVRGMRTMYASFRHPKALFDSARLTDWGNRYTPSIRIVFSLLAVMAFLRFLWASEGSAMSEIAMSTMVQAEADFPEMLGGRTTTTAAQDYLTYFLFAFPFFYFAFHGLSSVLVFMWGKATPTPVRIRLYFAMLIPALILSVLLTLLFALMTAEAANASVLGMFLVTAVLYAVTYARGMAGRYRQSELYGRAGVFGLYLLGVDFLVGVMATLAAYLSLLFFPVGAAA